MKKSIFALLVLTACVLGISNQANAMKRKHVEDTQIFDNFTDTDEVQEPNHKKRKLNGETANNFTPTESPKTENDMDTSEDFSLNFSTKPEKLGENNKQIVLYSKETALKQLDSIVSGIYIKLQDYSHKIEDVGSNNSFPFANFIKFNQQGIKSLIKNELLKFQYVLSQPNVRKSICQSILKQCKHNYASIIKAK